MTISRFVQAAAITKKMKAFIQIHNEAFFEKLNCLSVIE